MNSRQSFGQSARRRWFRMLRPMLAGLLPWLPMGAGAATIDAPSQSATGAFTVSWPAGYDLWLADAHWRVAAAPARSASFADLPAGVYRFVLVSCAWIYDWELGYSYSCERQPDSERAVRVAGAEPLPVDEATPEAGTLPYRTGVSVRGAAEIAVPLRTPPGVHGIALDLSLRYDSARGGDRGRYVVDDLLGYGWSLQGVPYVHRCRVGLSEGAEPGDVPVMTAEDGLCLDGQALLPVEGRHWVPGAEYRLAADADIRIFLHETAGIGRWFEVRYPDGSIGRFGDSSTSQVRASGQTNYFTGDAAPNDPYLWGLRKLAGAAGGELTVDYQRFDGHGVLQPARIAYGGAEIRFGYGARDDLAPVPLGTLTRVKRGSVLESIAVRVDGRAVREYRLASPPDEAGRRRLERIQECGYDREGNTVSCLPPLRLDWRDVDAGAAHHPVAVRSLVDGLGARTEYDYVRIGAAGNPLTYGEAPFGTPGELPETAATALAAVSEYRQSNGRTPAGMRRWSYAYRGLPRRSTRGHGYLGFAEMRMTDRQSGIVTYTQTRLDWPFVGVPAQVRAFDAPFGSQPRELRREEHAYAQKMHANGSRHAFRARSTRWLLEGGTLVGGVVEQMVYCFRAPTGDNCPAAGVEGDAPTQRRLVTTTGSAVSNPTFAPAFWGDVPQRQIAAQKQQRAVTEVVTYGNSASPWIRASIVRRSTTHAMPGQPGRTVTERFEHLPGTRIVASEVRFPGDPLLERVWSRGFESGASRLLTSETFSGANASARTWRYGTPYQDGRYLSQVTNPLDQASTRVVDQRFGSSAAITDPDGRTTLLEHDPFGRIVEASRVDGTVVSTRYERCDLGDCSAVADAAAGLRVTTETRNGGVQTAPTQVTYFDVLGREVLREIEGLEPAQGWRARRIGYDDQGRIRYLSRPVAGANAPVCSAAGSDCTWYARDRAGRIIREDRPDGGIVKTSFSGSAGRVTLSRTETVRIPGQSATSRTVRTFVNTLGQITEVNEAYGSSAGTRAVYAYDAHGNLASVTVDGSQVVTLEHDLAGNRTRLIDANSGITAFAYNGLGELIGVTDAKGQATKYEYDPLGRLVRRIDPGNVVHQWTWDPANATSRLGARLRPGFSESFAFGTDGRLSAIETQVNVPDVWAETRRREFDYDSAGRLVAQRYPNDLTVVYDYSSTGYLARAVSGGAVLHEWRSLDAFGNPVDERLDNGALRSTRSHDPGLGRLTRIRTGTTASAAAIQDLELAWRSDGLLYRRIDRRNTATTADDHVDTLAYDTAGRLTRQQTSGSAVRRLDFAYMANGNSLSRTSNVAGDSTVRDMSYAGSSAPYRLNGFRLGGVMTALSYDANGNVVRYAPTQGASTWLRYDPRNNVTRITLGSDETAFDARDEFWYDPDGSSFLSREIWNEEATTRTRRVLRLGGDYEEVRAPVGAEHDVVQRIQVTPRARLVRRRHAGSGSWQVSREYAHRDHLGSVESITDPSGAVLQHGSFDPFGSRRAADRASDITPMELEVLLAGEDRFGSRGFTDHAHRLRTGFIHAGGRFYDPRLGRYVSPDPMVQAAWIGQGYNRYGYVMNSPLSYVDPTGRCGTETGYQLVPCLGFDEHVRVIGGGVGGGGYFGGLDFGGGGMAGGAPAGIGGIGGAGGFTIPDLDTLIADYLAGRAAGAAEPERPAQPVDEHVEVIGQRDSTAGRGTLDDWLARGLANLNAAGVESLFGSGCVGIILGGCGVSTLDTSTGGVYALLMLGIVPGAGVAFGAESLLFASELKADSGYGTAVFVSGGVAGMGGSVGMAQGTNGFVVTGAVGYGFGFGGGVGFYYAMPVGSILR